MRIIFDSNIFVSAVLSRGFSYRLLQTVLDPKNGYFLFISAEILEEIFAKLSIFPEKGLAASSDIEDFKQLILRRCRFVAVREQVRVVEKDPDDNKILECAVAAKANLIVTMDKHLLKIKTFRGIPIIHPKTFSFIIPKQWG